MYMSILRRLFLVKEIKSKEGELHFQRWRLLQTPLGSVYIHRIFKADEDLHCHDHPWSFVGIILNGGYVARKLCADGSSKYESSTVSINKSTAFHQITRMLKVPTTTFVITGPRNREWGYSVDGEWIHHKEYRKKKRDGKL
jgi:hypothetical protein